MRGPLKIAFIGGRGVAGTYSGIETYYEEVGSRLAARGHQVVAHCRTHFTPQIQAYRGITVRRLPSLRTKHLDTLLHTFLSTLDVLPRGFDIVHYHALGPSVFSVVPRLFGTKTVATVHGLDWQRGKWGPFARAFLQFGEWASARCPTATVVVSRTLQRHYAAQYGRKPHFIPNAVVNSAVTCAPRPAARIRQHGLEKDGFLLFAGRLSPEKGVHTLLEALGPVDGRMPLVLAGGSSYSGGYIEQLRAMAWDKVIFLGNVDQEMMQELYSNCYAYILPSVMEGLSVGLLEALSYGACIVTTNISENIEVVGDAALSFPPGDVAALRELLRRVLTSEELVREYRTRAAAHAAAQPDWDEVARQTEALYYELLNAKEQVKSQKSKVAS